MSPGSSVRRELGRARRALGRGREDEALVALWNLVEPARLEGDEGALAEIGNLATRIARTPESPHAGEARRLLESLGRAAPAMPQTSPTAPVEVEPSGFRREPEPPPEPEPAVAEEEPYGELEGDGEPLDEEAQPPRRGSARWVIPLATLAIIVVNLLARFLRDD